MNPQVAVGRGAEPARGAKGDVTLGVQFPFYDEAIFVDRDGDVLQGGVAARENLAIHDFSESFGRDGDLAADNTHLKRSLVVEDGHFVFADGPKFAGEGLEVGGSFACEVEHDVAHFSFDGAGTRRRRSSGRFRGRGWRGGSGVGLRLGRGFRVAGL